MSGFKTEAGLEFYFRPIAAKYWRREMKKAGIDQFSIAFWWKILYTLSIEEC